MLQTLQIVTLALVSIAMTCSLADALELPGKLRLPREIYAAVQPIYYPGFTLVGGFGEIPGPRRSDCETVMASGHASMECMPTDACVYFFDCKGCGILLRPRHGDCCVFCSYGTHKCPPVQVARSCCT